MESTCWRIVSGTSTAEIGFSVVATDVEAVNDGGKGSLAKIGDGSMLPMTALFALALASIVAGGIALRRSLLEELSLNLVPPCRFILQGGSISRASFPMVSRTKRAAPGVLPLRELSSACFLYRPIGDPLLGSRGSRDVVEVVDRQSDCRLGGCERIIYAVTQL